MRTTFLMCAALIGTPTFRERGGWTQDVPLLRTQIEKPRALQMSVQGKLRPLVSA